MADGAGAPVELLQELFQAAAVVGDVELLLGWTPTTIEGLDFSVFGSVRTLMGGYQLRAAIDAGEVRYLPTRLGATPALLQGPLRPDVLVASVSVSPDGYKFLTEVSWLRATVDAGAVVVALERPAVPALDAGPALPPEPLVMLGSSPRPAVEVVWGEPHADHEKLARHVAPLVPTGARIQYAPGSVGTAVLDALEVPVHVDTGMITDAVVNLDRRKLLLGRPLAPYLSGSMELYEWSVGRVEVDRIERTHDPSRLVDGPPLVAVNTALEVDLDGQVNVESVGGSAVAGIGGQPDYASAASRSVLGLSIVALPTSHGRHGTLVERLSAPASTLSHDVDVIATERGVADLRGLDRAERRRAIAALWE